MKITLFVDKIVANDLGGITNDLKKAEYILAVHKNSFEKLLSQIPETTKIPSGMFGSGKYIICFNFSRDLSIINFALINYKINIAENFNAFADNLSPKSVAGFHKIQERIKLKKESELNQIEISDNDSDFVIAYGNYIEHKA